jgi:hypothetical protein
MPTASASCATTAFGHPPFANEASAGEKWAWASDPAASDNGGADRPGDLCGCWRGAGKYEKVCCPPCEILKVAYIGPSLAQSPLNVQIREGEQPILSLDARWRMRRFHFQPHSLSRRRRGSAAPRGVALAAKTFFTTCGVRLPPSHGASAGHRSLVGGRQTELRASPRSRGPIS